MEKIKYLLGVDDAGRGPVIGPMLLCGTLIEADKEKYFRDIGAKDSKLLTPLQREKLAEIIKKEVKMFRTKIITPSEIDTGMGIGLNLNLVEALACGSIINEITEHLSEEEKKNTKIILDCPSINTSGWKNQLLEYVKDKKLDIHCEHKADFNHVVVSAASIIAKVTRDGEIEKIKEQIGIDFGSGYPSDPNTKNFLREHVNDFKKERIFRESWQTWRSARDKALGVKEKGSKQNSLGEW
jgi:ribonuclease HII